MYSAQLVTIPQDALSQPYNAQYLYEHTATRKLLRTTDIIQPHQPRNMPQPTPPPQQQQQSQQSQQQQQQQQQPLRQDREPILAVGIPAMTPDGVVMVDDPNSRSTRSYTPVKVVGDGSFGTVWLCDWHGDLPANTPLSPMQCGAGARADWAGKRLVAVKRMKKRWEGGWEECRKLKELESLRIIPRHPNIIPLYDYFLLPSTKELYFVFECMEGNLYQLIKSRRGRPLAGGLVSSVFRQVVSGLHHIHRSGYFHRDMKPENLLVTTTGLHDYVTTNPRAPPNAPPERDVAVIVKLADFGLARETNSSPPYTEYVSTRWYRAPEVLLRSRDYSNPVDMWALGTIMAELVNLRPLFPGQGEIDQVALICEVLGDPSDEYGHDERSVAIGGGDWPRGIRMARAVGFAFAKMPPKQFHTLFEPTVPLSLIQCIADLLKYEPSARLTSEECMNHRYLRETSPPTPPPTGTSRPPTLANGGPSNQCIPNRGDASLPSIQPRTIPPSHSYQSPALDFRSPPQIYADIGSPSSPASVSPSPMSPYIAAASPPPRSSTTSHLVDQLRDLDLPTDELSAYGQRNPHAERRPSTPPRPSGPDQRAHDRQQQYRRQDEQMQEDLRNGNGHARQSSDPLRMDKPDDPQTAHASGSSKTGLFGFKKTKTWGLFGGGGDKTLPPVDEIADPSSSSVYTSLKRTQSGSTSDSRSLRDREPGGLNGFAPSVVVTTGSNSTNGSDPPADPKKAKKEADRAAKEDLKARRQAEIDAQRARARAVMHKREQLVIKGEDLDWKSPALAGPGGIPGALPSVHSDKGKGRARQPPPSSMRRLPVNGGGGSQSESLKNLIPPVIREGMESEEYHAMVSSMSQGGRSAKARRRDTDDDHSMSSTDVRSSRRQSVATVDSDPGPARSPPPRSIRERGSMLNIHRATSHSSLRSVVSTGNSSMRGYSSSARSSTSLEQGFLTEFASMNGPGRVASPSEISSNGGLSPHHAQISYPHSPHHSHHPHLHPPRPPEQQHQQNSSDPHAKVANGFSPMHSHSHYITLPPISSLDNRPPQFPLVEKGSHETLHPMQEYVYDDQIHPPGSPMNPMFHVPPLASTGQDMHHPSSPYGHGRPSLPPFSHIASVADQGAENMS